ncbi:MAG: hypothetical protein HWD92_02640 [Flavobacteriia bacterium]|nr:hypothetical protein [Flavobacteriia bacterium]
MNLNRNPSTQEERLLEFLVRRSLTPIPEKWSDGLLVYPMDDGGMGGLYLFPGGERKAGRTFGEQASEYQFTDSDGVEVIASLNLDKDGELFELDIWKTDFRKISKWPDL